MSSPEPPSKPPDNAPLRPTVIPSAFFRETHAMGIPAWEKDIPGTWRDRTAISGGMALDADE